MIRKVFNGLLILIFGLFLYKLFGGDMTALFNGVVNAIFTIGDRGSDLLLELWNKFTQS